MEESGTKVVPEADNSGISVVLEYDRSVNYAMQQNDVPVVKSLRITNETETALRDLTLRIASDPAFTAPWESRISVINPGETFNLGVVDLPLSHDYLAGLTERLTGSLRLDVLKENVALTSAIKRIDVLAYDEWNGLQSLPEILAAFVTPNHPAVESVLSDVAEILGSWTGNSAISGYQSRDPQRSALTTAAIYTALQKRNIRYINPPASYEESGQKIRLPDRILESRLATCLDLTVLAASCLEQAGLHPLVIITDGHAFVGVWLEDETFADVATDDLLRLRKRVELEQITLFETTLLTNEQAIPFEQAVKEASKHLEDENSFRYVLDICRARKSRIRPLPLRIELESRAVSDKRLDPLNAPTINFPSSVSRQERQAETVVETPASRLDRWKRKLLDLTLNNRLLNFRESKKNMPILCPDLGSLEDALADGKTFKIYPRLEDLGEGNSRNADVHRTRTGKESLDEMLKEEFAARRLHADVTEGEVSRRLLEIYREAKLSIEENGANTLYLALGFLSWYETTTSLRRRLAPIILIPLEIERRSVQDGFSIKQGDDEPMVNVTLLAHLEADFELNIPGLDPIPLDEHGIDVSLILRKFREAVVEIDRWEVLENAHIGHFSFTKFLMWRDLEVRADDLQKNTIVKHLIYTPSEVYPDDGAFPDPERLDETHHPEETFCPLSSDSSQLAAVHAAAAGKSFVLHGPPGTGKSQTITNIIAHNLAIGKTVLFVSEKRAALEVVHRRLTESGLGPYCLELHSNKSHKKAVLNQLEQALNANVCHSSEEWQEEAHKLAKTRKELNSFVSALHAIRISGESVFHGISQLIGHRNIPLIRLFWPSIAHIDRQRLNTLRETVHQLQLAGSNIGHPTTNVWTSAKCEAWSPEFRTDVEQGLNNLMQNARELSEVACTISLNLGMKNSGWSKQDLENLVLIAGALLGCPSMPKSLLVAPDWEKFKSSILMLVPHGCKRERIRNDIFSRYNKGLLSLDIDELKQKWESVEHARFLPKWLGFGNDWSIIDIDNQAAITDTILSAPCLPSPILSSGKWQELKEALLTLIAHGQQCRTLQEKLYGRYSDKILSIDLDGLSQKWTSIEHSRFLPQWLGCGNDWNQRQLDDQPEITRTILAKPSFPTELLEANKWDELKVSAEELLVHGRQCEDLQQKLFTRYKTSVLTLDIAELSQQWTSLQTAWFLPKFFGCRKIRKTLSDASLKGYSPQNGTVPADLELSRSCLLERRSLKTAEAKFNEILNRLWHLDRSDWLHVRSVLSDIKLPEYNIVDENISADLELALALRSELDSYTMAETRAIEVVYKFLNQDKSKWMDIRKTLAEVSASGEIPPEDGISADLVQALELRRMEQYFAESAPWVDEALGSGWNWSAAEYCINRVDNLRRSVSTAVDGNLDSIAHLCHVWVPMVVHGNEQLSEEGNIGKSLLEYKRAFEAFVEAEGILLKLISAEPLSVWSSGNTYDFIETVQKRSALWLQNLNMLRAWCYWRSVRSEAISLNLKPLIDAYERKELPTEKLQEAFTRGYYQWWCDSVIGVEPALCEFISTAFEDKIRQFKEIDDKYTILTRREIQARIATKLPKGYTENPNSEMGLLRRQLQRKVGHLPVRSLIQKIPNLLPRLKPCLLMSPISVAQYLDPSQSSFDLVVFDEASQIPVWDAVGTIARGKEAIIVGDPKQLPPTNFFARTDSGDGDDTDDNIVEDLESILDDCIAAQLPQRHLNWHYRSRHESLIAFSNYHYYGNRLFTFPSPNQDLGVSFRHVSGQYDKGKSRTNRAEAIEVVNEVLHRLLNPQQAMLSIGIVTFSQAQQMLIDDLLEEARRENPEIEPYFADGAAEPVFVKNLENVQGDERDVILFSICYGPDTSGRVSMNFGPMNRDGGERRLNVAITRARQEVIIFSTLRAENIDLSKTRSQGVADLKCFLDYAERGPVAIEERRSMEPEGECESFLEVQICDALRNKGYTVHPQVGCSGYRIDLAIVDPGRPGRYLLGIECDGANYHRSKTARDRDKLRESILKGLGWNLHRVWSTDWWERPEEELERIESSIELAQQMVHVPEPARQPEAQLIASVPLKSANAPVVEVHDDALTQQPLAQMPELPVYEPFMVKNILGTPDDFYDVKSNSKICSIIEAVVSKEGPVSLDLVARRVSEHWCVGRVTSRTMTRIEGLVGKAFVKVVREAGMVFLWASRQDPKTFTIFRVPGENNNSRRDAESLPQQEVANAALYVLEQHISLPITDLVRETARLLGYQRTGPAVDKAMRHGIKLLVRNGGAKKENEMVVHQ